MTLGRERWGQNINELAAALQKSAAVVTYFIGEGVKRRLEDESFASRFENLDAELVEYFNTDRRP